MIGGTWQALADRFGLGRVEGHPEYVDRGAMGEIWQLRTSAGRWAVKWQFPWVATDPRPADVQVQRAAAAAGIPLPLPVTAQDGEAVLAVGDRFARVYQWVDLGQPVPLPASAATATEAGRLLGLLHGLGITVTEEVDPWYIEVPEADFWIDLTDRAAASEAPWARRLDQARGLIADLSEHVIPPSGRPAIVCHRDFNPGNVLPSAETGLLIVLDWENAGPLDPVRELGYAVFCWSSAGGQFDAAAAEALIAGYAITSGSAPELDGGMFATAIATHVNVLHVMAEQALTEPEHRDFAGGLLAEVLDHDLDDLRRIVEFAPTALYR